MISIVVVMSARCWLQLFIARGRAADKQGVVASFTDESCTGLVDRSALDGVAVATDPDLSSDLLEELPCSGAASC
jgi:hypothetical protein